MSSSVVAQIAASCNRTPAQVVFRFALDVGMIVLTGTNNPGHMREDLDVGDFNLKPEEVGRIESLLAK
jgi:diketogulonate reductase-like aldo/keto reductase